MRFIVQEKSFKIEKDRPRTFVEDFPTSQFPREIVKTCPAEVQVLFPDKNIGNVRVGEVYESSEGSVQLLSCKDVVELIVLSK